MTRIRPRALLAPPGWPDFMTRERFVRAGTVAAVGAGLVGPGAGDRGARSAPTAARTWDDAELAPADPAHPFAWRAWTYDWTAAPGRHELLVRATDEQGTQPVEQEWNRQGMANNLVQRVPVTVLD